MLLPYNPSRLIEIKYTGKGRLGQRALLRHFEIPEEQTSEAKALSHSLKL